MDLQVLYFMFAALVAFIVGVFLFDFIVREPEAGLILLVGACASFAIAYAIVY